MTNKTSATIYIKTDILNKFIKARENQDLSEFVEQAILEDLYKHGE